ncbi:MAG: twin-arginine translocation signal domain-containing protein, partial [Sedimentisphaerales bacterium]|nr:twin-arginine translocation signal domain-containing protein [Sedimentisphaerales bacterium]
MSSWDRRQFLKASFGTAAAWSALSASKVRGANEKIIVGCMGLGG